MSDFKISRVGMEQESVKNLRNLTNNYNDFEIGNLLNGENNTSNTTSCDDKKNDKLTPKVIYVSKEEKKIGEELGYDCRFVKDSKQMEAILNKVNEKNAYYFFSNVNDEFTTSFLKNFGESDTSLRYDNQRKALDALKKEAEEMGLAGTDEYYNFVQALISAAKNVNENIKNPHSDVKPGNINTDTASKIDFATHDLLQIMGKYITNEPLDSKGDLYYENPEEMYDLPQKGNPQGITISKSDKTDGEKRAHMFNGVIKEHHRYSNRFNQPLKQNETKPFNAKDNIKYLKHNLSMIDTNNAYHFFAGISGGGSPFDNTQYTVAAMNDVVDPDNILTFEDLTGPLKNLLLQAKSMNLEEHDEFKNLISAMAKADIESKEVQGDKKLGDVSLESSKRIDYAISKLLQLMQNYIAID